MVANALNSSGNRANKTSQKPCGVKNLIGATILGVGLALGGVSSDGQVCIGNSAVAYQIDSELLNIQNQIWKEMEIFNNLPDDGSKIKKGKEILWLIANFQTVAIRNHLEQTEWYIYTWGSLEKAQTAIVNTIRALKALDIR